MSRHWKHGGSHAHSRLSRRCRRCRKGGEGSTQTLAARCIDHRITCCSERWRAASGPLLPFMSTSGCCGAARRTSHSCIVQHFGGLTVGVRDEH